MSTLTIRDLRVDRAGRPILRGLDLDVAPGIVTTLLGPNGAGKSTLVLALAGLLPARSGTARLGDLELLGNRPDRIRAGGVAAVPEGHRVLTQLSVRDNLTAALGSNPNMSRREATEMAFDVFPELEPVAGQLAGSLSGGQQQMLAFAQALVSKPDVLLIDEMSLGLAPVIVQRLTSVVARVADQGIGVLLIEQYANLALSVASRAYVIHKGEISFAGPARDLIESPDELHAAYFGATTSEVARQPTTNGGSNA